MSEKSLQQWVEDDAGSDASFYYWLHEVQIDAANFIDQNADDERVPPALRDALRTVADFEVIVP